MTGTFDVAIVGLGAMGSAAAYHFARRGLIVLGLDRFTPPHPWGSTFGESRIIREAYFEGPLYVPLVQRALELWGDLARETARLLFRQTGGLMIGGPESELVVGSRRSAEQHNIPFRVYDAAEIRARFPGLRPRDDMIGLWEPRAGVLAPEPCVQAHLDLAVHHGAMLCYDEPLERWEVEHGLIRLHTSRGEYRANRLVLTCGPWLRDMVPELALPLSVERQVVHWFEPRVVARFDRERCPVHIWEHDAGRFFYGFPNLGSGVKVAVHHEGEACTAETVRREVSDDDVAQMRELVARYLPDLDAPPTESKVCLYTNTPDGDFLIDHHPQHDAIWLASVCSGHGFKFSSAIGELLADIVTSRTPAIDPAAFRLAGRALRAS